MLTYPLTITMTSLEMYHCSGKVMKDDSNGDTLCRKCRIREMIWESPDGYDADESLAPFVIYVLVIEVITEVLKDAHTNATLWWEGGMVKL